LGDRIGTLEPGKDADLCAVSLEKFNTIPSFNPLAALFHAGRGSDVVLTAVRGRILYRAGKFTTIDVPAARAGVEAAASRLKAAFA
jgi:5-methylthioadenosine/S-adenosylhomocysteine deaminase